MLFTEVTRIDTNQVVADHLWFTKGRTLSTLRVGDMVEFDARVGDYVKGYAGRREVYDRPLELDYKLKNPTKLKVISRVKEPRP